MRSSIGAFKVCASSNTTTTGWSRARPSIADMNPACTSMTNPGSSPLSPRPKSSERNIEALRLDPAAPAEGHVGCREVVRRLAGEDLAWLGRRLQPRCRVDDRPGDQQLACRRSAYRRLAGLDADADLETGGAVAGQGERVAEPVHSLSNRKAGAHGSQGVVFVHVGQPEHCHHP